MGKSTVSWRFPLKPIHWWYWCKATNHSKSQWFRSWIVWEHVDKHYPIPQSHFLVNYCPISGQEFGEFFPAPAATGDWLDDKPILWFQEDLQDFEARLEKKAAWIRTATATGIWGILGRLRMVQLFGGLHGFTSLKYGRWPGEIEVLPSKNEGFHPWMGSYQHDTYRILSWWSHDRFLCEEFMSTRTFSECCGGFSQLRMKTCHYGIALSHFGSKSRVWQPPASAVTWTSWVDMSVCKTIHLSQIHDVNIINSK